jgi:hypothetical protein
VEWRGWVSTDLESRKVFGRFVFRGYIFDVGLARTAGAPVDCFADGILRAFEDRFDATVREVYGPSGQAEAVGLLASGVPEKDTLDSSRDKYVGSFVVFSGL